MLCSEAIEIISLAPQLFRKHKIWGRSASRQLITFFYIYGMLPLSVFLRLSTADPLFSRWANNYSLEGSWMPHPLLAGTSPDHWSPQSEPRTTCSLCQQMRKGYCCCCIAYGDKAKGRGDASQRPRIKWFKVIPEWKTKSWWIFINIQTSMGCGCTTNTPLYSIHDFPMSYKELCLCF